MSQNLKSFNEYRVIQITNDLLKYVNNAACNAATAHEVEVGLWDRILEIGRTGLQCFFDKVGTGDLGESVELPDGRVIARIEEKSEREYTTVFGKFTLTRATYGVTEKQTIELVPVDTRLKLPEGKFSYLLQDWDQSFAIENSFGHTNEIIQRILKFSQAVDSLERMNQKMAIVVDEFRDTKEVFNPETEGSIIVVTADGKGIPMKKEVVEKPIANHKTKGIKLNKKQMAIVGSVYTIDPLIRKPEDVIRSLFATQKDCEYSNDRPRACNKSLYASLSYEENGKQVDAGEKIFSILHEEVLLRSVHNNLAPTILLMDGQRSLWELGKKYLPCDRIEILDLLHVTPRLWMAAHLYHKEGSKEAEEFVKKYLLLILQGKVEKVIRKWKSLGIKNNLRGNKKSSLTKICKYLLKNKNRLHYDKYMEEGYPIASGVIEGACRYFIKDRMERAGMRWTIDGAQAMLDVRSVFLNGDWVEFQKFRIKKQEEKLYPHSGMIDVVAWPLAA